MFFCLVWLSMFRSTWFRYWLTCAKDWIIILSLSTQFLFWFFNIHLYLNALCSIARFMNWSKIHIFSIHFIRNQSIILLTLFLLLIFFIFLLFLLFFYDFLFFGSDWMWICWRWLKYISIFLIIFHFFLCFFYFHF